jgi:hypothetical protein
VTYIPPHVRRTPIDTSFLARYAKFACHCDSSPFNDISVSPLPILSSTGTSLDTTAKKFGAGSLLVSGAAGSGMIYDNSGGTITPSTGDFTMSAWVNITTLNGTYQTIMTFDTNGGQQGPLVTLMPNNALNAWVAGSGGGWAFTLVGPVPSTGWNHVVLERWGNRFDLYLNGTSVSNNTYTNPIWAGTKYCLGYSPHTSGSLANGNIDEAYVWEDIAYYKGNFTVPAAPYIDPAVPSGAVTGEMRQFTDGTLYLCTDSGTNTWKQVQSTKYQGTT